MENALESQSWQKSGGNRIRSQKLYQNFAGAG